MPPKPPRVYCCVNGCINMSVKRPELSFFKLPKEKDRRNKWLKLISREDLSGMKAKSYVVCEEHFHAHEILRAEHRKNLKKNVLPSLKLPGDKIRKKVAVIDKTLPKVEKSTQTTETNASPIYQTDSSDSKKRKLYQNASGSVKKKKKDEVDNRSLKHQKELFHRLCDKFLTKEYSQVVKNISNKEPIIKTPHIPITTEINEKVLSIFKVKVDNMKEKERVCSVIIDCIDIRTHIVYNARDDKFLGFHEVDGVQTSDPATVAIVLMVKGIVFNWQQLVGFALLSEYRDYPNVIVWIDKLIFKLGEIGLDVKAVVSNMETDMYNLAEVRKTSPEKPFFSLLKMKKLFYVYDASHLLIMIRDSFLQNEFHFRGHVAKIDHIKQFYSNDFEKTARLAPKLTQNHIDPNDVEKKDVRVAAQLFSNSVAATILTYLDFYVIDESGRDTAILIKLINDLYDLLTSIKLKDDSDNVFKTAFNGDPAQLKLLTEAVHFFRTLKLVDYSNNADVTSTAKFIEGFQITISAVMLLLEDLKKSGISYLRIKRLSTGPTTKFFSQIRSKCGIANNPTSRQFMTAYREQFIKDLMKPPAGKDCSIDITNFLSGNSTSRDLDNGSDKPSDTIIVQESDKKVQVKSSDYKQIQIPENNILVYLSSYLLKRCAEKHRDCKILSKYTASTPKQRNKISKGDVRYKKYRDYSEKTCSSLLVVPNDDFIAYVELMEEEFRRCLKSKRVQTNFAENIYKEICNMKFEPPCPCFPLEYLRRLFIRIRIFHTVQANNKRWQFVLAKRKFFNLPSL